MMKVVFLDRDGVINEYPGDSEYVKSWEEFSFLPNSKAALKKINKKFYKISIISNQAGVGRGIYSQENLDLITQNMLQELKEDGVKISGVYYCTHRKEENCSCRKPKTGLIDIASGDFRKQNTHIDFKRSYFVGDTIPDIETGKAAGLKTILVFSGKEKSENKDKWQIMPDFVALDLSEAAEKYIV